LGQRHVAHRRLASDLLLDRFAVVVADPEPAAGRTNGAVQLRAAVRPALGRAQRLCDDRAECLSHRRGPSTNSGAVPPTRWPSVPAGLRGEAGALRRKTSALWP